MDVVEISTTDTHPLRRAVLRDGDPLRSVEFPEDDLPGTFHLGVRDDSGEIVATSTWVPKQYAGDTTLTAVQLRGMATSVAHQGAGLGGLLIEAGAARCAAESVDVLWARARDAALVFYGRHRCEVVGDGFIDETTQLPHHIVVRDLRA